MKRTLLLGCLSLGLLGMAPMAQAYELQELEDPIRVISGVPLHQKDLNRGTDYHATLEEAVQYDGWVLPEGTQFIGHVDYEKYRHRHHHWGHWGHDHHHRLEVWIDQVVFPNGQKYTIYPNEQIEPNTEFHAWTWNGRHAADIDPGERMSLEFKPAVLKGLFYTAATRVQAPQKAH